jgi:hypothetical protein
MENKYFIHDGAEQKGPFSIEELQSLNISKESMVWCEGLENWKPAGEIEELQSIFPVVAMPPPLETKTNTPPPFINAQNADASAKKPLDEKEKKKRLYMIIGGSALLLLLTVGLVLAFTLPGKESDKGLSADSLSSANDSLNAVNITDPSQPQSQAGKPNAAGVQNNQNPAAAKADVEDKEEAQRKRYAGSWRNYITASVDFRKVPGPPPIGTMVKEVRVTVHNNSPYYVDEMVVYVNFLGSKNEQLKSERVAFKGVPANSTRSLDVVSSKGYSAETRINKVTSNSMKLYYQ